MLLLDLEAGVSLFCWDRTSLQASRQPNKNTFNMTCLTFQAPADDIVCIMFLNFQKKIRHDSPCESSAVRRFILNIKPYLLFLKKQHNLKMPSAANYRWHFNAL